MFFGSISIESILHANENHNYAVSYHQPHYFVWCQVNHRITAVVHSHVGHRLRASRNIVERVEVEENQFNLTKNVRITRVEDLSQ